MGFNSGFKGLNTVPNVFTKFHWKKLIALCTDVYNIIVSFVFTNLLIYASSLLVYSSCWMQRWKSCRPSWIQNYAISLASVKICSWNWRQINWLCSRLGHIL